MLHTITLNQGVQGSSPWRRTEVPIFEAISGVGAFFCRRQGKMLRTIMTRECRKQKTVQKPPAPEKTSEKCMTKKHTPELLQQKCVTKRFTNRGRHGILEAGKGCYKACIHKESPGIASSEAFILGWAAFMYHPRPATCKHSRQLCLPMRRE